MSTQVTANLGSKGHLVNPQSLRQKHHWTDGSTVVLLDDDDSVRLMSANEALGRFRKSVAGTPSPVDDLIAERRQAAADGH